MIIKDFSQAVQEKQKNDFKNFVTGKDRSLGNYNGALLYYNLMELYMLMELYGVYENDILFLKGTYLNQI